MDRVDVGRSLSADRSEHAQTDEIDDQAAGIDRRTSADDPIWSLMGLVDTGGPGDVARNADLYLADASTAPVDIRSTQ